MNEILDFKAIGKRIKEIRIYKEMSQEQLANAIDTTASYISAIETGASKTSLNSLVLIANVFECSLDELVYDNSKYASDKFDADARLILRDCTPKEKDTIIRLMKYSKETIRDNYGIK